METRTPGVTEKCRRHGRLRWLAKPRARVAPVAAFLPRGVLEACAAERQSGKDSAAALGESRRRPCRLPDHDVVHPLVAQELAIAEAMFRGDAGGELQDVFRGRVRRGVRGGFGR